MAWLLLTALPSLALAQPIANPDFAGGLTGWTVIESGGTDAPGSVSVEGQVAVLREGDSFLVGLEQGFDKPAGLLSITIAVDATPGLDLTGSGLLRDTFEIAVLDAQGYSLVPAWASHAATFYNLPEGGPPRTGSGATVVEGTVTVDVAAIKADTKMTLRIQLIGGDGDEGSEVRVGPIGIVNENVAPIASATAPANAACDALATVTLDGSGSSDPDGDPVSYEWRDASGAAVGTSAAIEVSPPVGTHVYTLFVRDDHQHEDTTTVTVVVGDDQPPAVSGLAEGPIPVAASEACAGSVPDLAAEVTATDACSAATVVQSPLAGAALALGAPVVVTITATDAQGNQATLERTVTLVDETDPAIDLQPASMSLPSGETCTAPAPDLAAAAVATDNCPGSVLTQVPAAGEPLSLGETTVELTATDGAGHAVSVGVAVTVLDGVVPVVTSSPEGTTVSAGAACDGAMPDMAAVVVATDACGDVTKTQEPSAGTPLALGKNDVNVSVKDAAGNSTDVPLEVTLVDDTPPATAGALTPVSVPGGAQCAATVPDLTDLIGAQDACGTVTVLQSPEPGAELSPDGATQVALTLTDVAGNTAEMSVSVSLDDAAGPLIGALAETIEVPADAACAGGVPDVVALAKVLDTCGGDPTVAQDVPAGQSLALGQAIPVTLTATDAAGNSSEATVKVVLVDQVAPALAEPIDPIALAADAACAGVVPDVAALAVGTDACGEVTITQLPLAGTAIDALGAAIVELTLTDAAGNTATVAVPLTLLDQGSPSLALPEVATVIADAACQGAAGDRTADATAADACGEVALTQDVPEDQALGLETPTLVTVTAKDAAGNAASAAIAVSLVDQSPPEIAAWPGPVTLPTDAACAGQVPDLTAEVQATDACGAVAIAQDPPAGAALMGGAPSAVVLTVSDAAGNEAEVVVDVTLVDTSAPALSLPAPPAALAAGSTCSAAVPDLVALALATDACDAPVVAQVPPAGAALPLGTSTVTLSATDAAGNQVTLDTAVTVVDESAPAVAPLAAVEVATAQTCAGEVPDLAPAATDNCAGDLTAIQAPPAGTPLTVADLDKAVTVTVTVTDVAGNATEVGTTVTLVDPTGVCDDTPGPGADAGDAPDVQDQPAEPAEDDLGPAAEPGADVVASTGDAVNQDPDAGAGSTTDTPVAGSEGGCGCRTAGAPGADALPSAVLALVLLAAVLALRRRRANAG